MRRAIYLLFVLVIGCQQQKPEELVRSNTYYLHQANYSPVSGDVIVSELSPGKLEIAISLKNTKEGINHPTHLHFGSVREVGELAFKLEPVDGATGRSVTVLDNVRLSNDELLTYDTFLDLNGSIKVHMDDMYFKNMVLAFGNVGANEDYFFDGVAMCTGH